MTSDAGSRVFTMFRTGACVVGPQMTGWAESPEKRRYMAPTNMASTTTAAAATRNNVGSPVWASVAVIQRGRKVVGEREYMDMAYMMRQLGVTPAAAATG